jgi:hypothetical protein
MMFSKAWARTIGVLGHPADSKAAHITHSLAASLQSMRIDLGDLDLDSPADAFEALRRIASEAPVMHGEAPEFHRA